MFLVLLVYLLWTCVDKYPRFCPYTGR